MKGDLTDTLIYNSVFRFAEHAGVYRKNGTLWCSVPLIFKLPVVFAALDDKRQIHRPKGVQ